MTSPEVVRIEVGDGAVMVGDWYPPASGRAPSILVMTPYGRAVPGMVLLGRTLAAAGFGCLVTDVRGFGDSVAPYEGLLSERELKDGLDLVEWLTAQPFNDGNVGLGGGSYTGINQLLVAQRRPSAVRCIAPFIAPIDTYRDWTRRGGIPSITGWGGQTYTRMHAVQPDTARRGLAEYYGDISADPFDGPGHRRRSPVHALGDIDVPTLVVGGWWDLFGAASVRTYAGITAPRRLVMGPWGHFDAPMWTRDETLVAWHRHWLLDGPAPSPDDEVRLFRGGDDVWLSRPSWPDAARCRTCTWQPFERPVDVPLVQAMNVLPPALNAPPSLRVDPLAGGFALWGEALQVDGGVLDRDLDLEGSAVAVVAVTPHECDDVELHLRLSVLRLDGTCDQVTEGRLLAGHRALDDGLTGWSADGEPLDPWHPHDARAALPTGEVTEIAIGLDPLVRRVFAGERLRLGVTALRAGAGGPRSAVRIDPATRVVLALAPAH